MLSERLRNRELFKGCDLLTERQKTLDYLDSLADTLVLAMVTAEVKGVFDREVIEEYVIASIEASEAMYYGEV